MSPSFEFPGEYYEIIRSDFRNVKAETDFFCSYLPDQGRVLDVGCGTGTNLRALHEKRYRCVGVDQSAAFIEYAKKLGPADINYQHARAATFLDDEPFDLIFCIFVTLNYMNRNEIKPFFDLIRKHLQPNGKFVVDIGHMLNFSENYQPYIIAHHRQDDVLITRLIRHQVNPHLANWRHEETIVVRDSTGTVSMYENFFDQMALTAPELERYLSMSGLAVSEVFGSFRKDPPSRNGHGHLIMVAQRSEDIELGT